MNIYVVIFTAILTANNNERICCQIIFEKLHATFFKANVEINNLLFNKDGTRLIRSIL